MLRTLLNDFPSYIFIFSCIMFSVVAVVLVLAIKRKFFPNLITQEHNDMTIVLVRVLSALYAILLSLVVIALVSGYEIASLGIIREANAYSSAIDGTRALPHEARIPIQTALQDFIKQIIDLEWPAMRKGLEFPTEINGAIHRVYREMGVYEPKTTSESIFLTEILNQFNIGLDARAERWVFANNNADNLVKGILFFNAITLLIMICMLGSVKPRAQMALTILANSVVFAAFSLVMIMDYPFSGDTALTPEIFQELYNINVGS